MGGFGADELLQAGAAARLEALTVLNPPPTLTAHRFANPPAPRSTRRQPADQVFHRHVLAGPPDKQPRAVIAPAKTTLFCNVLIATLTVGRLAPISRASARCASGYGTTVPSVVTGRCESQMPHNRHQALLDWGSWQIAPCAASGAAGHARGAGLHHQSGPRAAALRTVVEQGELTSSNAERERAVGSSARRRPGKQDVTSTRTRSSRGRRLGLLGQRPSRTSRASRVR